MSLISGRNACMHRSKTCTPPPLYSPVPHPHHLIPPIVCVPSKLPIVSNFVTWRVKTPFCTVPPLSKNNKRALNAMQAAGTGQDLTKERKEKTGQRPPTKAAAMARHTHFGCGAVCSQPECWTDHAQPPAAQEGRTTAQSAALAGALCVRGELVNAHYWHVLFLFPFWFVCCDSGRLAP